MTDNTQAINEQASSATDLASQRLPDALSTVTTIDEMKAQFSRLQTLSLRTDSHRERLSSVNIDFLSKKIAPTCVGAI